MDLIKNQDQPAQAQLNGNQSIDNLYSEMVISTVISIHPKYLTTSIADNILQILRDAFEDKVISQGYIKKNSINNHVIVLYIRRII